MLQKDPREPTERETMSTGTDTLLDGADGTLHLANVTVMRNDGEMNRKEGTGQTSEVGIAVDITDAKAP
jgi:hypothetical protein